MWPLFSSGLRVTISTVEVNNEKIKEQLFWRTSQMDVEGKSLRRDPPWPVYYMSNNIALCLINCANVFICIHD